MKKELSKFEKLLLQKGDVELVVTYAKEHYNQMNYMFRHYVIMFLEQATRDEIAENVLKKLQEEQEVLSSKITEFNTSKRLSQICERENIKTVGDLTLYSRLDLAMLRSCGRKTIREVEDLLESLNLSLQQPNPHTADSW